MNDFLDRDQTTFVKASTQNRLGWEPVGESYSKYILGEVSFKGNLDLLSCAYRLSSSVISTITSEKVKLRLDPRNNYATSTKQIVISTQVIEEKGYSDFEKIDVMLGEAAHEAAHIAYTDFVLLSYPKTPEGETKHAICNILEDERIERLIGEGLPGYGRFLEKVKYYFFDKLFLKRQPKPLIAPTPASQPKPARESKSKRLFNLFFSLVRYPKYIQEQDLIDFDPQVKKIINILTPYPETNSDIKKAVEKIYALLKGYHEQKEKGGDNGEGETKSFPEEVSQIIEAINKVLSSSIDPGAKKEVNISRLIKQNPVEAMLVEGEARRGKQKDTYFFKAKEDRGTYERARAEVSSYAGSLANLLQISHKDYIVTHKHLRSGYLDTSRLAEGYMGVETVYERKQTIKSKELSIALLIDESGSMTGRKISEARKCGVLFKEALSKAPGISSFIYGHSADCTHEDSTDLFIYGEGAYQPKYALGSLSARDCGRDGAAILEVAKRIRSFSADPCLLFVISDGQPNASGYTDRKAVEHTKKSVAQAEALGFTIIQIAIEAHVPSEQMFTHFVKLTSLGSLPKDLGKVLKKALLSIWE